ncbi:hypothetical protein DL93DRAFT_1293211 [Clavulina sp. PMI_390]|nr:hypothetical protein DL93DRAFT_1293211 [Clavulina sp. PMI_390]
MHPSKGHACFQCREHKVCNGETPTCSRCQRLQKQCTYAADIARRALIMGTLEARALELELSVRKATLASTHTLSLVSSRLLERISRLGNSYEQRSPDAKWLPVYPQSKQSATQLKGSDSNGQVLGKDVSEGYNTIISRATVEHELSSHEWSGLGDLPSSISQHLIHLFLPFRSHYYLFMDISYFLHCFSLPPSDPESIHPCLLNACYLAACAGGGGALASLQPFFLQRTRHFLNQALITRRMSYHIPLRREMGVTLGTTRDNER